MPTSIVCSATAALMRAESLCCTCSPAQKPDRRDLGCPCRGRSEALSTATVSSDYSARRSRRSHGDFRPERTPSSLHGPTLGVWLNVRVWPESRRALGDLISRSGGIGDSSDDGAGATTVTVLRTVAVAPIRLYQRVISPAFGSRCKYYPSCSEYAAQSISRFGILRGLVLAGWRLLRCNPWSHGGFDPVEDQRLFKTRRPAPSA